MDMSKLNRVILNNNIVINRPSRVDKNQFRSIETPSEYHSNIFYDESE